MKAQTLLAFDFGLKRIGVAVGQTRSCTATELDTVRAIRGIPQWDHVDRLVNDWEPDALVVGAPPFDHGSTEKKHFEKFGSGLVQRYNLPLLWVDESLTTEAANFELQGSDASSKKKQAIRDRVAARLILESHFNSLNITQTTTG